MTARVVLRIIFYVTLFGEHATRYSPLLMFLRVGNLVETGKNLDDAGAPKCAPNANSNFDLQQRISLLDDMALVIGDEADSDDSDDGE